MEEDMTDKASTIAITGAGGALGGYAALHYSRRSGYDVRTINRGVFQDPSALKSALDDADVVLHLAGMNRGDEREVAETNPALAHALIEALEACSAAPHVIYSSSIHEHSDNTYGRSKREAGDVLAEWADQTGANFTRLVLPHIYSELVRPHYNSAIATFCHSVAAGGDPHAMGNAEMYPMHADEVCEVFDEAIANPEKRKIEPKGVRTTAGEMLEQIKSMHASYAQDLIVPDLRHRPDLHLFNTYRAHLFPGSYPLRPILHADARGDLFEAVRELNGGQAFISTTRHGVTRGNHFHFHKVERFCVLRGEARIELRHMVTGARQSFDVSGNDPCFVDIPTLWTHNITNTGDADLLTLFWTNELFNPDSPDTYFEEV